MSDDTDPDADGAPTALSDAETQRASRRSRWPEDLMAAIVLIIAEDDELVAAKNETADGNRSHEPKP